jgi:hypothetical protein
MIRLTGASGGAAGALPLFVQGASFVGTNAATTVVFASAKAGDVIVQAIGDTGASSEVATPAYLTFFWPIWNVTLAGYHCFVGFHVFNPGDPTTIPVATSSPTAGNCVALFRNVATTNDGIATGAGNTSSTTPTGNGYTTSVKNSLALWFSTWQTTSIGAAPSDYTTDEALAAVSGTSFGCVIGHKLIASPGAVAGGVGSLTIPSTNAVNQMALMQL